MADIKTLPYEKQAMNGDPMPTGMIFPDQVMYLCLRNLYSQLRNNIISRDTAMKEKKELLEQYRVYLYREEMGKQWVEVIKKTELARAACRKEPSQEHTMDLIQILEGMHLNKIQVPE